jgi:3,4-dehydroadipyl-CoA semialdehyde dehydrogenase
MTQTLKSHLQGGWHEGSGGTRQLNDPTTGELLAEVASGGLDFAAALAYARNTGGPALRAMSFQRRGAMLLAMSKSIHAHRDELLGIAERNGGNTRGDGKFDIDGCTGTLAAYAKWGDGLGEARFLLDGEAMRLSRSSRYVGRHVLLPLQGVAIHINAFNFPAWGFGEKAAVALLAGVPVVTKPATSTALVTQRIIEILVEDEVLPAGALSYVAGSVGDLLDHVGPQDVVAFTGSANTGRKIRGNTAVMANSVRVNIEADSLNACVVGPDVKPESETWDLFVREVARDMTQKAGQKCTAMRRLFVPAELIEDAKKSLKEELASQRVGHPGTKGVRVGPLATASQLEDIRGGIDQLMQAAEIVHGEVGRGELTGIDGDAGCFQTPVLLQAKDANADIVHQLEVFGPVATLLPYSGDASEAAALVARGQGMLVTSCYTDDRKFAGTFMAEAGPWVGRLNFGSRKVAEHSVGPGTVLPQLVHGGPGRAGGGEELGGLRGLRLYLQRTALQGDEPMLAEMVADGVNPEAG